MFQTTSQYIISVNGFKWYIINHNAIYSGYDEDVEGYYPLVSSNMASWTMGQAWENIGKSQINLSNI